MGKRELILVVALAWGACVALALWNGRVITRRFMQNSKFNSAWAYRADEPVNYWIGIGGHTAVVIFLLAAAMQMQS